MTSNDENQFFGPPPPITELTLEQEFKVRQIEDAIKRDDVRKEDIITIFLALQRQNFVLGNNMTNLLKNWNLPSKSAVSLEDI